jgi:hypothetical protein
MKITTCPEESELVHALRSGQLSNQLLAHVADCAACGESSRVAEWLGRAAERIQRDQELPDPAYVWFLAELERCAGETKAASLGHSKRLVSFGLMAGVASAAAALIVLPIVDAAFNVARTGLLAVNSFRSRWRRSVFLCCWWPRISSCFDHSAERAILRVLDDLLEPAEAARERAE